MTSALRHRRARVIATQIRARRAAALAVTADPWAGLGSAFELSTPAAVLALAAGVLGPLVLAFWLALG